MLSVQIIAVGRLKESWLRDAMAEYAKRLGGFCRFTVTEVEEYRLPEDPSPAQIRKGLEEEGREILRRVGKTPMAALCIEGKQIPSRGLASLLEERQQLDSSLAFVIGGSFGLSEEVKAAAFLRLSMSEMTFPHQLARVMLAEQLYRAFSILRGSRYHK